MASLSPNIAIGPITYGGVDIPATGSGGRFSVPDGVADEVKAVLERRPGVTITVLAREYNVGDFGAVGDGVTDDTAAINAAVAAASAAGGGTVTFDPSGNYVIRRAEAGVQAGGGIRLCSGVSIDGRGAALTLEDNCALIVNHPDPLTATTTTITANVVVGDTTVAVANSTGFAAGDRVGMRLGDNIYDTVETRLWMEAVVVSVPTATTIVIDRPFFEAVTVASQAAGNKTVTKLDPTKRCANFSIRNLRLMTGDGMDASPEQGIWLRYASNVLVENIYAENPGAGAVMLSYCENVVVRNLDVPRSDLYGQASKGRVFACWNSRNVLLENAKGAAFEGRFCFIESYSRQIQFQNIYVIDNHEDRTVAADRNVFFVGQDSELHIDGVRVEGNPGVLVDSGGTPSVVTIRDLSLFTSAQVVDIGIPTANLTGMFRVLHSGVVYDYQMDRAQIHEVRIPLVDDMYEDFYFPAGVLVWAELYYSEEVVPASMFTFGNPRRGVTGDNGDQVASVAGVARREKGHFGTNYPFHFSPTLAHKYLISTAASSVTGANAFVVARMCLVRAETDPLSTEDLTQTKAEALGLTPLTVSGDRSDGTALANLLSALEAQGIITDSTVA